MKRLAEYIWIDGTEPVPSLRSKTKVLKEDTKSLRFGGLMDRVQIKPLVRQLRLCVSGRFLNVLNPFRGFS